MVTAARCRRALQRVGGVDRKAQKSTVSAGGAQMHMCVQCSLPAPHLSSSLRAWALTLSVCSVTHRPRAPMAGTNISAMSRALPRMTQRSNSLQCWWKHGM